MFIEAREKDKYYHLNKFCINTIIWTLHNTADWSTRYTTRRSYPVDSIVLSHEYVWEHYSNLNPSACGISEYGILNIRTVVDLYILFIIMPLICGGKQGIVTKVQRQGHGPAHEQTQAGLNAFTYKRGEAIFYELCYLHR